MQGDEALEFTTTSPLVIVRSTMLRHERELIDDGGNFKRPPLRVVSIESRAPKHGGRARVCAGGSSHPPDAFVCALYGHLTPQHATAAGPFAVDAPLLELGGDPPIAIAWMLLSKLMEPFHQHLSSSSRRADAACSWLGQVPDRHVLTHAQLAADVCYRVTVLAGRYHFPFSASLGMSSQVLLG